MHPNSLTFRAHPIFALMLWAGMLTLLIGHASAQEPPNPAEPAPPAPAIPEPAAPSAAPAEADSKSPALPEVQVIQENETPKPTEDAAPKPKKNFAPVAQSSKPQVAAKPKTKPQPAPAPLPAEAVAVPQLPAVSGEAAAAATSFAEQARANPSTTFSGEAMAADGYTATNTATFKSNAPLLETPAGISVVTDDALDDQAAVSVRDALRGVAGVQATPSLNNYFGFNVRGFRTFDTYRNGMRADYSNFDLANVERIEVLKGPAGMLYGRMDPGGLINIVTKKPLETAQTEISQEFGSFDYKKTIIDSTGPVTSDKKLLYRFVGSYTDSESFRDFIETEHYQINPSVIWKPVDGTEIFLDFEVFNDDYRNDYGIPAIGRRPANIPISRSLIDPNDPIDNQKNMYSTVGLSQRLTEDWTLRSQFMYRDVHSDGLDVVPAPAFDPTALRPDNRTLDRNLFFQSVDQEDWTWNIELYGKFNTGPIKHELMGGYERYKWDWAYDIRGDFETGDPALAIDIFNPVYGLIPKGLTGADVPFNFSSHATQEWHAGYVSDHMTIDRLHIVAGVRYDDVTSGRGDSAVPTDTGRIPVPTRDQDGWSPRAGVLYELTDQVSVYANWAKGFAGAASSPFGTDLPPEESRLYETGVKYESPDKKFAASLAFFHLTKSNIATDNPVTPDPFDQRAIGEARSRGIEVDFSGQLTRHIEVLGSYAYTEAAVLEDFGGLQGKTLDNVPDHAGSLWLTYDFDGERETGWVVGAGVTALGARFGDAENTLVLPGYARFDAMAGYEWDVGTTHMALQLNVKNIFDTEYYESTEPFYNAHPRNSIYPGAPRELFGTLKVSF